MFISDWIQDLSPSAQPTQSHQIEISDIETNELTYKGENKTTGANDKLTLIRNPKALNNMRILWLRDSFGTALSPFMAATFSEVIQRHWSKPLNDISIFESLVDTYKPDLVIFTMVGRSYASHIRQGIPLDVN